MSDWFFGLSLLAMVVTVFAITYLLATIIFLVVTRLASGSNAKNFKALTPAMLSPLGAVFALLLVFSAEPVWTNYNHAKQAIATEASGLRDRPEPAGGNPGAAAQFGRRLCGGIGQQGMAGDGIQSHHRPDAQCLRLFGGIADRHAIYARPEA
jgi:hypothetical protein